MGPHPDRHATIRFPYERRRVTTGEGREGHHVAKSSRCQRVTEAKCGGTALGM
jgi:hypothetical protein